MASVLEKSISQLAKVLVERVVEAVRNAPLREVVELLQERGTDRQPDDGPDSIRRLLVENLARLDGNVSAVARAMGKQRTQVRRWIDAHGLQAGADDPSQALRRTLVAKLERHAGNVSAVARDMGKQRTQVYRWISRFALKLP